MKPIVTALLCLLGCWLPGKAVAEFFGHLGLAEGLSQPSVMAIYQDNLGRMWLGTHEGINVYDGNQVVSYKGWISNHPSLRKKIWIGNHVNYISGNKEGDIFFIADNSLFRYDLKKELFECVKPEVSVLSEYEGAVWCGKEDSLYIYNAALGRLEFVMRTDVERPICMRVLKDKIYIGSRQGLYIIGRNQQKKRHLLPGIEIYSVYQDSYGETWVAGRMDGLYRIDRAGRVSHVPCDPSSPYGTISPQIREFAEDDRHNIWFGTFYGLQKYDRATGTYSKVQLNKVLSSLEHPSIFALYKDKDGIIWVGTYYGGVNFFNPLHDTFTHYNYALGAEKDLYYSFIGDMVEDRDKNLWLATDGGGISRMDAGTRAFTNLRAGGPNTLPHNNVKSLAYDSVNNCLYIGTYLGGLSRYDLRTRRFHNYLKQSQGQVAPNSIIHRVVCRNGMIYISARNGIFRLDPSRDTFTRLYTPKRDCETFDIDSKGHFYLADGSQLVQINLANPAECIITDFARKGCRASISKVMAAPDGIYIGTLGDGLFHYTPNGKITRISVKSRQLLSDYCYNMGRTKSGIIVITSEKGVTLHDPKNRTSRFIEFSNEFPAVSLISGCGLYINSEDRIFIGDTDGFTTFLEKDIRTYTVAPDLYFSSLWINNTQIVPDDGTSILPQSLPYLKQVKLKAHQNNVKISFATRNYVDALQDTWYEYKLDGFDKDWITTNRTDLQYTNLEPGTYTLRLRSKNDVADRPETSLQVVISRPWFTSWWAWLIYISLAGTGIFYYRRIRRTRRELTLSLEREQYEKKNIEQVNQAKLVFFTNVSHEFRTPLTLIIGRIDQLLKEKNLSAPFYNQLLKINRDARYMKNLVTELLDFRKFEQDRITLKIYEHDLHAFLKEIWLSFYDYAKQRGITYKFTCSSPSIPDCWFDSKQMEKVFFNLLSNAFKYTPDGGTIEVEVTGESRYAYVHVKDTGVGIKKEDAKRVFERFYQADNGQEQTEGTGIGLALTRSIIDKHHGSISVESKPGKGSTFTVCLPLGKHAFAGDKKVEWVSKDQSEQLLTDPAAATDAGLLADAMAALPSFEQIEDGFTTGNKDKEYTLLVVEDNKDLAEVLARIFSPFYKVIVRYNGQEGLDAAMKHRPDLIVSDVMMPVMTGTEMCVRIKNNMELCHIPIILLTALNTTDQNIEGINRGADDYITKPFDGRLLLARCNNLIRNRLLIQSQLMRKPLDEIDLTAINPLDQAFLQKLNELMEENLGDPDFNIPAICETMAVSRSVLYTKFKALLGITPNAYIQNFRLKRAAIMLHNCPNMTVEDISDHTGFSSVSYFRRCFKSQYNLTPGEYREQKPARQAQEE